MIAGCEKMINKAKENAEIIQDAPKKYFLCKNINKKYLGMEVYDSRLFTKMTVFFICKFTYGIDIDNLGEIEIIIQHLRMHWPKEYSSVNLNKASVYLNENHISLTLSLGFFDRESSQKLIPLKQWLMDTVGQLITETNRANETEETGHSDSFIKIREELDQLIEKGKSAAKMEKTIHVLKNDMEKQKVDIAESADQTAQLVVHAQEQKHTLASIQANLTQQQKIIDTITENQSQYLDQSQTQKETLVSVQQELSSLKKEFAFVAEKVACDHADEQLSAQKIAELRQEIEQQTARIKDYENKSSSISTLSAQSEKSITSIEKKLINLEQDLREFTQVLDENQKNTVQRVNEINLLQQDITNIRSTEQTIMTQLLKSQEQLQHQLVESASRRQQKERTFSIQPETAKKLRHFGEPQGYPELVSLVSQLQEQVSVHANLLDRLADSVQPETIVGENIWTIDKIYHFEQEVTAAQKVEPLSEKVTEILLDTDEVALLPVQGKKQIPLIEISEEQRRTLSTLETKICNNFEKNKSATKHFVKRKEFQKLKHEIEYLDYFWTLYQQIEEKKLLFQGTLNCESLVKQSDSFIDKIAKIYRYARIFNRWVYCPGSTFAELQGYFYVVKYLKYYLRCTDE